MEGGFEPTRKLTICWVGLWLPFLLASCRVTPESIVHTQQSNDFDRLNIIYCVDSPTGPLFSAVPKSSAHQPTGIVQTAAVEIEETPFEEFAWSKVELRVECPHPDGRRDYAHVVLKMLPVECGLDCDQISWNRNREERMEVRQARRDLRRERWLNKPQQTKCNATVTEMDLPRSEVDLILCELHSHGFFSDSACTGSNTSNLEVRLNRRWTSKAWGYEPILDQLTTRVYEQGSPHTFIGDVESAPTTHRSDFPYFGWTP